MKTKYSYLLFIALLIISSCDIIDNDIKPDKNIYKIIGNTSFDKTYFANELVQTKDSNYLVLGSNFAEVNNYVWLTPYLSKLDNKGNLIWETDLESPYVNPVGIWENNGIYFIACMNETTLGTHILSVNLSDGSTQLEQTLAGLIYPLALVKTPDGGIAIEGYERNTRRTTLNKLNASYEIQWTQKYPLIETSEELVIDHISKRGKQYPFFVGYSGDNTVQNYFVNGFYQYSFSLIFTNEAGNFTGVVNGFRYESAVSSAISSGDNYFMSMFDKGTNYLMPFQTINANSIVSVEFIESTIAPRFEEDASIKVKKLTIDGKELVIYVSSSKNNQILFYIYDALTGEFITSSQISDYYPIEINDIIQTKDGGIAIIGQTIVTGRFPRIFFLKVDNETLGLNEE